MFQKYASYQTADFVADPDFIEWVRRPTAPADQFWLEFLEVFPHQQPTVQQARHAVRWLAAESGMPYPAPEDAKSIWEAIDRGINSKPARRAAILSTGWARWAAAAVVVLTLGIGWYLTRPANPGLTGSYETLVEAAGAVEPLVEIVNTSVQPRLVKLPDGSTLSLERDSRVSYSKSFSGKNREVYLTGAAFFRVTKNPEKPFLVYANELVTKVLGTSFRIQAFEKERNFVVSVKTGRVSVYAHKSTESPDPETTGILLTPNQEVSFARAEERFSRTLIEQPSVLLGKEELQRYSFDDAPVSRIFDALEKAYGVDIVFDEEVMAHCHLTTSLSAEKLFDKLEVICEAIGASYKVVDAQVVISGRGCEKPD